jgi:hypothetical protein
VCAQPNPAGGAGIIYIGAFEATRHWGGSHSLLAFGLLGWVMKQFAGRGRRSFPASCWRHHRALSIHLGRTLRLTRLTLQWWPFLTIAY